YMVGQRHPSGDAARSEKRHPVVSSDDCRTWFFGDIAGWRVDKTITQMNNSFNGFVVHIAGNRFPNNERRMMAKVESASNDGGNASAKTVAMAMKILSLFTHASPTWTVKEMAHQLDLPYSTAYRYVSTIEALGFLVRDRSSGVYTIGLPA